MKPTYGAPAFVLALSTAASAQCGHWEAAPGITPSPTGVMGVGCITTWDPDGGGPLSAELVACGDFVSASGITVNGVAGWNGSAWHAFGAGLPFSGSGPTAGPFGTAVATFDPDGGGPSPQQLFVGGQFARAGLNYVTQWNGSAWVSPGGGLDSNVFGMLDWDPDGDGPMPHRLVAAGLFGGHVAQWDGVSWNSIGSGLPGSAAFLTTWDSDGAGPARAYLIAGGDFHSGGLNYIARWDGTAWLPLGQGFDNDVFGVTSWDPDGPGPLSPTLIAGGWFRHSGGSSLGMIARWDGSSWQPLGSGIPSSGTNASIQVVLSWDPDGDGPIPPQLVAAGSGSTFTSIGGTNANRIARWDGTTWQPFGTGLDNDGYTLTIWDPDGPGPQLPRLVAGGRFQHAGGIAASCVATWVHGDEPYVLAQPSGVSVCAGSQTVLSAGVTPSTVSYQWRRAGVPIVDGAMAGGSVASGTTTSTLTLSNFSDADSGLFDCVASNGCGTATTAPAIVGTHRCCESADFDGDGDVGTDADIQAFFACLAGNCCATCETADFDLDGDVGTDADIEAFFRILAGGPC